MTSEAQRLLKEKYKRSVEKLFEKREWVGDGGGLNQKPHS